MGDNLRSKIARRGPLGLSLGDEDAFLTYVRGVFNQSRGISESQVQNSLIPYQENNNTIQVESGNTRDQQEMSKASHMPALKLKIGSWEKETTSDGEVRLLAKFYYLKKRIVWEVLEIKVGRKRKLEMRLDDILNIIPIFTEGRRSILRVELKRVPMMAIEKEPERNKHTIWIPEPDFTGGQALVNMIHVVEFEEGILEKQYKKLLLVEPRLSEISRLNSSSQQFNSSMDVPASEQMRDNVGSLANHINFSNPVLNVKPIRSCGPFNDQRLLKSGNNELYPIVSEGARMAITENDSLTMKAPNIQPVHSFSNFDDQRKLNNELTPINQTPTNNTLHLRASEAMRGGQTAENVDFGKIKEDDPPLHSQVENNGVPQSSEVFQNIFMNDEPPNIDWPIGADNILYFPTPSWVYWQ